MRFRKWLLLAVAAAAGFPLPAPADSVSLGTAGDYAVLAGTTVLNSGATSITGNVGAGESVTGLDDSTSSTVDGGLFTGNAVTQPLSDLSTAYNYAAGLTATTLASSDLEGLTLIPGVYRVNSSASLTFLSTGTLTLDDQGDPNALFVFQINGDLVTDLVTSVRAVNSLRLDENGVPIDAGVLPNVFWQVEGDATIGLVSSFQGHILAQGGITVGSYTTLWGSVLAQGDVTLDSDSIVNYVPEGESPPSVPLPRSAVLVWGLVPVVWLARRRFTSAARTSGSCA